MAEMPGQVRDPPPSYWNRQQENLQNLNAGNKDEILGKTKQQVFDLLKKTIRPEFLNRIDELIMFSPLSKDEIRQIVKLQFNNILNLLKNDEVKLTISDEAVDWIADIGFDPQYGARPIKRILQKWILNELSKQILQGKITRNQHIMIEKGKEGLEFKNG